MSGSEPEREIDCVGMVCPLPIVHARRALDDVATGACVAVTADDPHAEIDFKAFCARTGNDLVRTEREAGVLRFVIRRTA